MKILNKTILIIMVLNVSLSNLYAQKNPDQQIKISGNLIDEENKIVFGKIFLSYSEVDWFTKSTNTILSTLMDANGTFAFNLPDLNKPYKISMFARDKEGKGIWNATYYVEPKDNVIFKIVVNKDSISCSGYGSEKYNLVYELEKQQYKEYGSEMGKVGAVKDTVELNEKMNKLFFLFQKFKAKKQRLIKDSKISLKMKSILNHEYAQYDADWRFRLELLIRDNANYRKNIVDNYFLHSDDYFEKPDSLSMYCHRYWYGLSCNEVVNLAYEAGFDKIKIEEFYNFIKNKYSGYNRDRLISNCFFAPSTMYSFTRYAQSTMDSLINDALTFVSVPYIRKALIDEASFRANSKIGQQINNSEFIGLDGKLFKPKSLLGKVYIIDGWFNGCGGCASFHRWFEKEIYPEFKNNSDFVVLSINVDKTRDRWIKGIQSKLYTSENYINITTGSWFDHPFTNHYGIIGAPFLILVGADGNIAYKPETGTWTKETWIEEINKALKRKSINN